jgi:DNA-binding response OmpR family regulator
MSRVLVVADDEWVVNEVHSALSIGDNELIDHADPSTAAAAVESDLPDVAVVDLQVASMGGMAITRSIRELDEPVPVVMLLDREADVFIAGRAGANAWVVKPFSVFALRTAVADASGAV